MSWHGRTPAQISQYGYFQITDTETHDNCTEIYNVLSGLGWTLNAICGFIGNCAFESVYNPWSWESNQPLASTDTYLIDNSLTHGYGLSGFTPSGKYLHYPQSMSSPYYAPCFTDTVSTLDPNNAIDGIAQLERVNVGDNAVYVAREPVTFQQYINSTDIVARLTYVWMRNHENPASYSSLQDRINAAEYWYQVLSGGTPPTPPTPIPITSSRKMPLWMMLRYYP